ncbi:MAG TPA: hypothetical protein EYQ46_19355 [Myxococcales bacterium]|nr:hypothetical protein [Myxococcales bacterium]
MMDRCKAKNRTRRLSSGFLHRARCRSNFDTIATMRFFALCVSLVLALFSVGCGQSADRSSRPNIIVVLADDVGWGSLGSYGEPRIQTPNLDRLAREGRRFTQAYAPSSACSPTRYGVMTGRYFWRSKVNDGMVLSSNAPLHIETDRLTIASLLKDQGYRTAAIGKWHLGLGSEEGRTDWASKLVPGPRSIGFDYFFGLSANPRNGPHSFIENEELMGKLPGRPVSISGFGAHAKTSGIVAPFKTDEIMQNITKRVTTWIAENHADPFFVYFAPNAVHTPIAPNRAFTGSPYGKYGDFIHEVDASVGQILATLDALDLAKDTLVIFTSDNGGDINRGSPVHMQAMDSGLKPNGDLRGGKLHVWEGGFRVPFIVRWPGQVPEDSVSEQILSLTDLLATFAQITDVPLPDGAAEDSFDMLAAFTESTQGPPLRNRIVLQAGDATFAIREADWKLVERADPPDIRTARPKRAERIANMRANAPQQDQLFFLAKDPSEENDVGELFPERAARMRERLALDRSASQTRP